MTGARCSAPRGHNGLATASMSESQTPCLCVRCGKLLISWSKADNVSRRSAGRSLVRNEGGAVLILALVFVLIVSVSVLALLSLGGGSLLSTGNLRILRSTEYAADGAVDAAMQATRYSYNAYTTSGNCLPNGARTVTIAGVTVMVNCSGTLNTQSASTRVINFYACLLSTCTSGNNILSAQVTFDDYSHTGSYSCAVSTATTCGTGMMINNWVVKNSSS